MYRQHNNPDRFLQYWSALVNIRRKALLSLVGFRKHMTSRSPRSVICDSSALRSSISDLFDFGERFCPTFWIIPLLIPINSNKKMSLPPFKGCFEFSSLFLLRGILGDPGADSGGEGKSKRAEK